MLRKCLACGHLGTRHSPRAIGCLEPMRWRQEGDEGWRTMCGCKLDQQMLAVLYRAFNDEDEESRESGVAARTRLRTSLVAIVPQGQAPEPIATIKLRVSATNGRLPAGPAARCF